VSAFDDCVAQLRGTLDRRFGTEPRAIHLRVLGASFLFLGCFLLGGRANLQWAVGYASVCFGFVVAPSRKDLERTYGARFVGGVRASLILAGLFAILAFIVTIVALSAKVALSPSERPGFRVFCGLIVVVAAAGGVVFGRSLRRPTKA